MSRAVWDLASLVSEVDKSLCACAESFVQLLEKIEL